MVTLGELLGITLFLLTHLPIVIKSKLTTKARLLFSQELECTLQFVESRLLCSLCWPGNMENTIVGI